MSMPPRHEFRVLIVEDDFDIRAILAQILADEGYLVTEATNGAQALEKLRGGLRPTVILLDLMMPVMSGWQFREEQLLDPELAQVPVVIISADSNLGDKARTLKVDSYLRKPVDIDALLDAVAKRCAATLPGS